MACRLPSTTFAFKPFQTRLCSAASSVPRSSPSSQRHRSSAYALRLPDSIDESKVEARFDKGVLKVTALKRPEAVKAEKKIEIKKG